MLNARHTIGCLLLTATLAGCGQTGPLYLPKSAAPAATTGAAPASVTPASRAISAPPAGTLTTPAAASHTAPATSAPPPRKSPK